MQRRKPDLLWILVLVIAVGAATGSLMGDDSPRMTPQQAGIIVQ
ncbi:MAG: hypothetical protein PVJ95_06380 [Cellvibrionales bacterium]|jgi:hypothetical protein